MSLLSIGRDDGISAAPAALAAPRVDPIVAARRLADLGFLAGSDLPDRPGPASLLVALRAQPTLHHFDPERVDYWVSEAGFGVHRALTRDTSLPFERAFSWGLIRIVDRLRISNEYLTFGGNLSVADVDGVTVAVFTSPAPLLRRGGHSQGWDHGAQSVGAFFGRLLVAVDFIAGFEARLAETDPIVRYAAFILDLVDRYRGSADLRSGHAELWALVEAEARRLGLEHPQEWSTGRTLLEEMAGAS